MSGYEDAPIPPWDRYPPKEAEMAMNATDAQRAEDMAALEFATDVILEALQNSQLAVINWTPTVGTRYVVDLLVANGIIKGYRP